MKKTESERRAAKTADTKARRFETGVIATLVRGREECTRHFLGDKADATRAVAAFRDKHGYKVRVLSTPSTILRDLQGGRFDLKPNNPSPRSGAGQPDDQVRMPEQQMLGWIGRLDLLAGRPPRR